MVPGSAPDHRKPYVVLRVQHSLIPGIPAPPEAPLRLPRLLRARAQRRARPGREALPPDPRRPLPLLERPPDGPARRRRPLRPQAIHQIL